MATEKKKEVKVRDLKPSKDAKGGGDGTRRQNSPGISPNRPGSASTGSTSANVPRRLS